MGCSKKHQGEGGKEVDGKKWVVAGMTARAPLKPICTKAKGEYEEDDGRSTTPTAIESRIPERLPCPPAPRKRRPTSTCHFNGGREFFIPPDLESVFIRHVERAS